MNEWQLPKVVKIYESLTAVASDRVEVISTKEGKVWSSSGNKYYEISYNPETKVIYSNDNSSFWKDELGYPAIAFLMKAGFVKFDVETSDHLKNITWKDINKKHINNFESAAKEVLCSYSAKVNDDIHKQAQHIFNQLIQLHLMMPHKKKKPPKGY